MNELVEAIKDEKFNHEIVPIEIKTKKETKIIRIDEHPKNDMDLQTLDCATTCF